MHNFAVGCLEDVVVELRLALELVVPFHVDRGDGEGVAGFVNHLAE